MICFCWDGFPQYAARCIRAFVQTTEERVVVLATKPTVPIKGMDELCGCEVKWIERVEPRTLTELLGEMPTCVFIGGWNIPSFNHFRDEARIAGGRAIGMCDNNFVFSLKECLKAIRFRLRLRGKYDAFFVPGKSGVRLLSFYGVPRNIIATGMYSADAALFKDGLPLAKRKKKMLYVGQFIERKNVLRLCEAFRMSEGYSKGWTIDLYGSGPLREMIPMGEGIAVHDFMQPEQLAEVYRESRCFILPSIREHWGVVVHEAALSGCVLLLSDCIGAGEDFLAEGGNGFSFRPKSVESIAYAMRRIYAMTDEELNKAHGVSLNLASHSSLNHFAEACSSFTAE